MQKKYGKILGVVFLCGALLAGCGSTSTTMAVDMPKEEIRALEEKYARLEVAVISNNSAHRGTPDVPMIIPELNAGHSEVITFQKQRLHTSRGFIAVKST